MFTGFALPRTRRPKPTSFEKVGSFLFGWWKRTQRELTHTYKSTKTARLQRRAVFILFLPQRAQSARRKKNSWRTWRAWRCKQKGV